MVVAAVTTLICVHFGSAAAEFVGFGSGARWDDWFLQLLPLIFVFVPMAVAALLLSTIWKQAKFPLGPKPVQLGAIGLLAGLGVGILAALVAVLSGNGKIIAGFAFPVVALPLILYSFATFIQVAGEELLFRGWLIPAIGKQVGQWFAVILSSLLFCGIHVLSGATNPIGYANLFLGGLALGLIFLRTKGLIAPIFFHSGFNWAEEPLLGLTPIPSGGSLPGRSLMDIDLFGGNLFGGGEDGVNTALAVTAGFLFVIAFVLWRMRNAAKPAKPIAKPATLVPASNKKDSAIESARPVEAPTPVESPKPLELPKAAEPLAAHDQTIFMPSEGLNAAITPSQAMPAKEEQPPAPVAVPPEPTSQASIGQPAITLIATHQGAVRSVNEDRLFSAPHIGVWAVADGMGGHRFGDRASTLIVEYLEKMEPRESLEDQLSSLHEAVTAANLAIYTEAQENGSRMGSTVVACVNRGNDLAFLWAGDSRAYRLRNGQLQQLTRDHTQVQELVERGELTAEQAARHPMSHVLVRAVGVTPEIDLETSQDRVVEGDIILLCSDGIYDALDESEIVGLLARRGDASDLTSMTELAVAQGARDNVTAIAIIPTQSNVANDRK